MVETSAVIEGERGPFLDLDYSEIDSFPTDILEHTQLRELRFSHSNLSSIPCSIVCLNHLEVLRLQGNDFEKFPKALCQLACLETLNLAKNQLSSIPEDIRNLTKLKTFELQYNKFRGKLSENISNLSSLEKLNVSNNKLTTIPECFANLVNLQQLLTSHNSFSEVPTVVKTLVKLKSLDLSYNHLQMFQLETSSLQDLEDLDLEGNQFSELSDVVCKLKSLKRLDVGRNCISAVPDGLASLTSLEELWLDENKFTSFPVVVCKLKSLQKLSLSSNDIGTLSNTVAYLDNLKILGLEKCGLKGMMPLSICMLRNLEQLYLGGNDITKLPVVLRTSLPNLKQIDLTNNKNLKMPPVSVYRRGIRAIYNYMDETETMKTIFHKLVFLGLVDAGKSSLTKTMIQGSPHLTDEGDTTVVLDKLLWTPEENMRLQVYDFGGSELYCVVQHFFLGPNSLVCLVVSLTDYSEARYDECVEEWLNVIQARAPRAKLFIVVTHTDLVSPEEVATKKQSILRIMHEREDHQVKTVMDEIMRLEKIGKEAASAIERLKTSLKNRLNLPKDVYAVSSKTFDNIEVLKRDLLKTANEVGGVIPVSWLQLYDILHCSELSKSKTVLTFKDINQMAMKSDQGYRPRQALSPVVYRKRFTLKQQQSVDLPSPSSYRQRKYSQRIRPLLPHLVENDEEQHPLEMEDTSSPTSNRLENIVSFFHSSGDLLWYEDNKDIRDYVFHKQSSVIDLLKSIFSAKNYDVRFLPPLPELGMTRKSLERAIGELNRKGILSVQLLKGMLHRMSLEDRLVNAIVDLLIHFGLCYKEKVQENKVTKLHFPWFLSHRTPPQATSMLDEPPSTNSWRFILEYDFPRRTRALFEAVSVHIHREVHDEVTINHWKDGVYAVIQRCKVLLYRSQEDENAEMISFRVEGENTDELWVILTKLHRLFSSTMDNWPGIKPPMWLVCPHCTKNNFPNPYRFDGENVYKGSSPEGEDFVTCPNDGGREGGIPVHLIYPMKASPSSDIIDKTHVNKVAYRIGDKWRLLGQTLLLDDCLLEQIDEDYRQTQEKAHQVLQRWKTANGARAQLRRLLRALDEIGRRDILEELTRLG